MAFPDSVLNAMKTAADVTAGNINKATRTLLQIFEPSNTNIFDCILTPESPFSLNTALDIAITKLYLQSINIPQTGFTYIQANETKEISGVEIPETLTFKFLDNEFSFVRMWLNSWKEEIYDSETEIFADDQLVSKKKAILVPQMKLGIPQPAWIEMTGIKLKSISEFAYAQGSAEPLMIDVTVKVDRVRFMTLF